MRDTPDASNASQKGNTPQSDQRSPTATSHRACLEGVGSTVVATAAVQALGYAPADAAASTMTVPSKTAISLTVNGASSAAIYFGTAVGVPQTANFLVSLTPNTATGSVVLLEGNQQLGPALTLSGGQVSYATQLSAGHHVIEAVYVGDGVNAGSKSPSVVINRSPRPKPR